MSKRLRGNYIAGNAPSKVYGVLRVSDMPDLPIPFPNQEVFTTPGRYTWIVPPNVTQVSAVAVGGGGGGSGSSTGGGGGGGGGLGWGDNIFVTPGASITISVGAGGAGRDFDTQGASENGGDSYIGNTVFTNSTSFRPTTHIAFNDDGTEVTLIDVAGDDAYVYELNTPYDVSDPKTVSNDITDLTFRQSISVADTDILPTGVFFKPDGTKMYVSGDTSDVVGEYSLYTAWDISTAVYVQSFSVAAKDTSVQDLFFKPDGTKMYIIGATGDKVYEYDLSTAWDVSSATFLQEFSIAGEETGPTGLFFKPDGTKMYVVGTVGDDINEYDLSTPWDVTSASYLQVFAVGGLEATPQGVVFSADGSKMYVTGSTGDDINEYALSTPWDVSSAVFVQVKAPGKDSIPMGLYLKDDGITMYMVGQANDSVYEFTCLAPPVQIRDFAGSEDGTYLQYNADGTKLIVGAGTTGRTFSLATPYAPATAYLFAGDGLAATPPYFNGDGSKAYTTTNGLVTEYACKDSVSLTTPLSGSIFDIATNTTGTEAFVLNYGNDMVGYTLTTPYSFATAAPKITPNLINSSNLQSYGSLTVTAGASDLFVGKSGERLYIVNFTTDSVFEYELTVPYYCSSAVLLNEFSVSSEDTAPCGITFNATGTIMFVLGQTNDTVYAYNLSTAWDISSASYSGDSFSFATEDSVVEAIEFNTDGTKLFMLGSTNDNVYEYSLSSAYDITTLSYSSNSLSVSPETTPAGLSFNSTGEYLYVIGQAGDDILQYELATPFDITTATYKSATTFLLAVNPEGIHVSPDGTIFNTVESAIVRTFRPHDIYRTTPEGTLALGAFFKPDGTKMYIKNRGDNEINEYDLSPAWSVASASLANTLALPVEWASSSLSIQFNGTGTIAYVSRDTDIVLRITLSTPWDISTGTFSGTNQGAPTLANSVVLSAQISTGGSIYVSPDGLKMYVIDATGDDVNEYDLSVAWDVSSATFLQAFSVATEEVTPTGLFFKPDGTKMYVCGTTGDDVNEYSLSSAWDVSTASYVQNFSVSAQDTQPEDIWFKPDGTKMYVLGEIGSDINEYSLSSAWDISTASFVASGSVTAGGETILTGIAITSNGQYVYVVGQVGDDLEVFEMATPWDITTLSLVSDWPNPIAANATGIYIADNDTKLFVNTANAAYAYNFVDAVLFTNLLGSLVGYSYTFNSDGTAFYTTLAPFIYKYDLATPYDLTTATQSISTNPNPYNFVAPYVKKSFSVASQTGTPTSFVFGNSGLKLYVSSATVIYEYDLSIAYDLDTASYLQSLDVSAEETGTTSLYFKDDGVTLFLMGTNGDDVNEFSLSTAWDISSATHVQSFSVSAQETVPNGLTFKPDGTKMYVVGTTGDDVNEYALSTAWDISTATYTATYTPPTLRNWEDIVFNESGDKMLLVHLSSIEVFNLGTPWDVTTATLDNTAFSFSSVETTIRAFNFVSNGSRLFVCGQTGDAVYELGTYSAHAKPVGSNVNIYSMVVSTDETKIMTMDVSENVDCLTMSTAGDLSTATLNDAPYVRDRAIATGNTFNTGVVDTFIPEFTPDNRRFLFPSDVDDVVYQYYMDTPNNVKTASFETFYRSRELNPTYVRFSKDGYKVNIGSLADVIETYDLFGPHSLATAIGNGGKGAVDTTGGAGGLHVGAGGGNGGNAGGGATDVGGGGGGAGGYSGNGGSNTAALAAGQPGSGGGGGAGSSGLASDHGGGGGGVGILGEGRSGDGGQANLGGNGYAGEGGSGGENGIAIDGQVSYGGDYGGGAGGADNTTENGDGGGGAVRIIWGAGRAYPTTNLQDQ